MASIERLRSYLLSDPGNDQLACDLADALFALGDYGQAGEVLANLPKEAGDSVGVRFRLGRLALVAGRYDAAEHAFKRLSSEGYRSAAIEHDIAFAQLCQKQAERADATLGKAIEEFGESSELNILRARIALMQKDYPRAQAALRQTLASEPGQPVAWGLQALGLLDEGETEAAGKIALACLAVHPDQHEALLTAGTIALWQRDVEGAETYFKRALSRFPNSGRALSGFAQVLMLRGQLEAAKPELEHAVVAMPDHIGTWHALAWVQTLQGELAGARESYQRAYDLDRNFAETHGGLAVVSMLEGNVAEAEESMRRALKLDPKSINGRYAKSLLLENGGNADASAQLMAEVLNEGALPGADLNEARNLSQGIRDRINKLRHR